MTVLIENMQEKINVTDEINTLIKTVIELSLELDNFYVLSEVSVVLVDNERIQGINKEHRQIDKPTDVLSFPMLDFSEGDIMQTSGDVDLDENLLLLGDIVISMEMAKKQSEEYEHSFEREVAFLTAHGIFHLLGYDHMEEEDEKIMMGKQETVMEKLGLVR
jgi:probable rRNA maturation factor